MNTMKAISLARLLLIPLLTGHFFTLVPQPAHATIEHTTNGFLFTGTSTEILLSETNGSILSVKQDGNTIATSGEAGLWSLAFTTNNSSGQTGDLNASDFSTNSVTNHFSWSLPAPADILFLTYSNADIVVQVTLSNRADGLDIAASLAPSVTNVMALNLPAPLRFDPSDLTRFIAPNHSSDGVGMAYNANYFVAQSEDDPASWNSTTIGAGGYQTLYGGNLIFGDYVATNLTFTTNGVA